MFATDHGKQVSTYIDINVPTCASNVYTSVDRRFVTVFKNTEIYHRKWQTAAMLEMVATLVILGDAKRDLSCLYYWLNWTK